MPPWLEQHLQRCESTLNRSYGCSTEQNNRCIATTLVSILPTKYFKLVNLKSMHLYYNASQSYLVFLCSIKFFKLCNRFADISRGFAASWIGNLAKLNLKEEPFSPRLNRQVLQVLCGLLLLLTHSLWWLPIFTWDNTIKTTSNCESKELSAECEYVGHEGESASAGLLPPHQ